jgi:polysaccharide pyruvyl transferase WcaK-like protein
MYHAEFNLCMRFHSVLFAETLGVPYLAVDYTNGGKIKAFLETKGKLDRLISLQEVAEGRWKTRLQSFAS